MNRSTVMKFAASAVLLGTVAVGCKPDARPAALSANVPRAERQAAKLAAQAAAALTKQDAARAVRLGEDAVALAPREAAYRVLLGRAYIAGGRFVSAETALTDALTLSPDDGPAQMSLALARIALGKWDAARDLLAAARGRVGESDRGLALALAGDRDGGVAVLEQAARAEGADAKARQNYALGLALAGRWAESRSVAAQDLAPDQLKARMTEWARLSQPRDAWDQVAALLHVTPVEDGGMPTALALAAVPGIQTAALSSVSQAPVAPVAVVAPSQAEEMPAQVAQIASGPAVDSAPLGPGEVAQIDPPAAPAAPLLMERAAIAPPPLIAAPARPGRMMVARAPARRSTGGRFVVQLGAFSSAAKVETAWRSTARRIDHVAGFVPSSASFDMRGGTVYRLSLAGFQTRDEAAGLCRQIRAARGTCFVRPVAGDALAAWAAKPGLRLASR